MEIMQVEERGNPVTINAQTLEPMAIPLHGTPGFASSWSVALMSAPPELLRCGRHVIEIAASDRLQVYQYGHAHFQSLHFQACG